MDSTGNKYPTLQQLQFEQIHHRRTMENDIKDLEREFQFCNREEEPGRWFTLQNELRIIYTKYMERYGKK
jgi:hypothetical protein